MSDGGEICGALCGGLCAVCAASALWECSVFRACGMGDSTSRPCCGGQRGCCPGITDCCEPERQRNNRRRRRNARAAGNNDAAQSQSATNVGSINQAEKGAPSEVGSQTLAGGKAEVLHDGEPVSDQPKAQLEMSVQPETEAGAETARATQQ